MAAARMRGRRRRGREVDPVLEPFTIDEEVSHHTRIRSEPCHITHGAVHAGRKRSIWTFEVLSAKESGRSGADGFSSVDCAYAARKHLPTKGPWCVDDMDSEAYVTQFSSDGSLLVAGFRGSRIRIYDAKKGSKVHKDISCRSLRWTVSDIALLPDQRYLAHRHYFFNASTTTPLPQFCSSLPQSRSPYSPSCWNLQKCQGVSILVSIAFCSIFISIISIKKKFLQAR